MSPDRPIPMIMADPPFEEAPDVRHARATARKLAASPLPFSIVGEPGTGRATLAMELVELRRERLGAKAWSRIRGSVDTPANVTAAVRTDRLSGGPIVAIVDGIDVIDAPGQRAITALIRERKLSPIFVGGVDTDTPEHPRGMSDELRAVVAASVTLPPLRERGEDVVRWAELLLARAAGEFGRGARLRPEALAAIRVHAWRGNLWELDGRLRKALALADEAGISSGDLDLAGQGEFNMLKPLAEAVEDFKAEYVAKAIERCGGNRTQTAKLLGVDVRTIFRYVAREKS